jgi:hypothetical protein
MPIKGECSECYFPLDAKPGQTSIICPSCGCIHDIVYIPTIRPRRNQPSNKPYQQIKPESRNIELAKLASLC